MQPINAQGCREWLFLLLMLLLLATYADVLTE
jgi:hypothetical protein